MEVIDTMLSGIYVIVGVACVVTLGAIFIWSKGVVGDIATQGSSIALAEKLLSAPCINEADLMGSTGKFVYNKSVLDSSNNTFVCNGLPGASDIRLQGTLYNMEIKSSLGTWYLNNTNQDYAYNTHARGITKGCISDRGTFPFLNLAPFKKSAPSPYNYKGNVLRFSGVVINNDEAAIASIKVILDADSGTEFYPEGYPLCLCDMPCPFDACTCSKKCDKALEIIGSGDTCT